MARIAQIEVSDIGGTGKCWMYKVSVYETGNTWFFQLPQKGISYYTPEAAFQAAKREGELFYKPAEPGYDWEQELDSLKQRLAITE